MECNKTAPFEAVRMTTKFHLFRALRDTVHLLTEGGTFLLKLSVCLLQTLDVAKGRLALPGLMAKRELPSNGQVAGCCAG